MVSCNGASFSALRIKKDLSSPDGSRSQKDVMSNQVSIQQQIFVVLSGPFLFLACIPPYGQASCRI